MNNLPHRVLSQISEWTTTLPIPKNQFPSIPRNIPELQLVSGFLTSRMFLFNFMVGFLLMAIVIVGEDIILNHDRLETLTIQRVMVEQKIAAWKSFVETYQGYRDGYYQIAVLEDQLGNKQAAFEYGKLALQLDPDFTAGKEFLQRLTR